MQEESKKTTDRVLSERRFVIEAAVVKALKQHKKMTMNALIQKLPKFTGFASLDVNEVKDRISGLIEREFMRKDEKDPNLLHYVA